MEYPIIERQPSYYNPLQTFYLAKGDQKHYQQQYGDMYFLRLAKLKPVVEEIAAEAWGDLTVGLSQELWDMISKMLRTPDSGGKRQARRSGSGRKTGRALLGCWNSLHGHAIETQHSRRHF